MRIVLTGNFLGFMHYLLVLSGVEFVALAALPALRLQVSLGWCGRKPAGTIIKAASMVHQ
jgi:hypothetical protein